MNTACRTMHMLFHYAQTPQSLTLEYYNNTPSSAQNNTIYDTFNCSQFVCLQVELVSIPNRRKQQNPTVDRCVRKTSKLTRLAKELIRKGDGFRQEQFS
jgi:hypothetical protein